MTTPSPNTEIEGTWREICQVTGSPEDSVASQAIFHALTLITTNIEKKTIEMCLDAYARSGLQISGISKKGDSKFELDFLEPLPDVIAFTDDEKFRAALQALSPKE